MLRSPKEVIRRKIVDHLVDTKQQIQQVGIDVTLRDVYRFRLGKGVLDFDNKHRKLPEVECIPFIMGYPLKLAPGVYIVTTNEIFKFGNREFGHIYPRSSLNRCGVSLESAIFDPGYEGSATVLLLTVHNPNGFEVWQNAKIGQMIVFETGFDATRYRGVYQGKTEIQNKVK